MVGGVCGSVYVYSFRVPYFSGIVYRAALDVFSLRRFYSRDDNAPDRSKKMHKRGRRIIGHAEITGETLGGSRSL